MSTEPTIRDEWVEKAAKALAGDWNPDRDPILSAMFLDYAQTALSAVADDIRAEALREAADWVTRMDDGATGSYREAARHIIARLRGRADRIGGWVDE